ncbi:MAG: PAS domain S-box protein [Bacteroidetes bacterium]|nr:PAS domain S-box protein [Bacteroidota bacterium]MCH8524451.1 PAS domain S-box protein [Balneolales bacterium]
MSREEPKTDYSEELLHKIQQYNSELEQRIQEHVDELREEVLIRKRSEQALRESQRRFQTLVEKIPEVIFQLDTAQRIRYLNGAWTSTTGIRSDEVIGEFLPDLFDGESRDQFRAALNDLTDGKRDSVGLECRFMRENGTEIWFDVYADVERGVDQKVTGVFGMAYNITRRKLAEDDMRRALTKEKELSRLRSQFVSMTSHEFRTPLASILTSSELLEHYSQRWSHEKNLLHLKRIQSSVKHIVRLMDDVLILGKSDVDRLNPEPVPVRLKELIRTLIDEYVESHEATQNVVFDDEMDCNETVLDDKLFRQIFGNIFSNALKYSLPDSTITVSLAGNCEMLRLSVNDDGIGIPTEDMNQLFEPFYRARNAGNVSGTGLGMSIVKRSVEAMGGTVHVSSEVGRGTRVHVILDLSDNNVKFKNA